MVKRKIKLVDKETWRAERILIKINQLMFLTAMLRQINYIQTKLFYPIR